jgi:nitrite reductase (NADH) large subunit
MQQDTKWGCTICGYIHVGSEAPACCPICGVTAELFEALPEAREQNAKPAPKRWRCINCDFIHDGDAPPQSCLICGVGPEQFEAVEETKADASGQSLQGSIVIIGGGIAGISAAEAARRQAPDATITLVNQEKDLPYYRLNLTRYLAGEIDSDQLAVHPEPWYKQHNIKLLLDTEATAIDTKAKTVKLKDGQTLAYDRLILTTGAHPSVPPVSGAHRKRVVSLRSCKDADEILQNITTDTRCVVVGGGLLGLETAAALAKRKVPVTVVEGYDWLLPRQLNHAAGKRLAKEVESLGITLICGAKIKELDGDEQVRSVVLESGQVLAADMVIIAAGVRSNSYLARMAKLDVNTGVIVDNQLRTSDSDIFAAGDLSEYQGVLYGAWAPAQLQGTVAGTNAAGGNMVFDGVPRSYSIKVIGSDLFSVGMINPGDASYQIFEENGKNYTFLVFRDSFLVGAILMGDSKAASNIKKLIEEKIPCAELLSKAKTAQDIIANI